MAHLLQQVEHSDLTPTSFIIRLTVNDVVQCGRRPCSSLFTAARVTWPTRDKQHVTWAMGQTNRWVNKLPVTDKDKNFVYPATGSPCRCRAAAGWAAADSRTDAWRCTSPVSSTWRGASATCRLYRESPTWTEDCIPSPPVRGDTVSLTFYSVHHLHLQRVTELELFTGYTTSTCRGQHRAVYSLSSVLVEGYEYL